LWYHHAMIPTQPGINAYAICWSLCQEWFATANLLKAAVSNSRVPQGWMPHHNMPPHHVTAVPSNHLNKEMQDDVNLSLAAVAEMAATKPAATSRLVEVAINCGNDIGDGNSRNQHQLATIKSTAMQAWWQQSCKQWQWQMQPLGNTNKWRWQQRTS